MPSAASVERRDGANDTGAGTILGSSTATTEQLVTACEGGCHGDAACLHRCSELLRGATGGEVAHQAPATTAPSIGAAGESERTAPAPIASRQETGNAAAPPAAPEVPDAGHSAASANNEAARPGPAPAPATTGTKPAEEPVQDGLISTLNSVRNAVRRCNGGHTLPAGASVTFARPGYAASASVGSPPAQTQQQGSCDTRIVRSANIPKIGNVTLTVNLPFSLH